MKSFLLILISLPIALAALLLGSSGIIYKAETNHLMVIGTSDTLYFKSMSSGLNKRITLNEYIQLCIQQGNVNGSGAGESEGDPYWTFSFSGVVLNDTTLKVEVSYKQEGVSALNTSEIWIFDKGKKHLHLKNRVPMHPGALSYSKIERGDIPTFLLNCILTISSTAEDSLGFTNKAEAKNLRVNGLKEGKWFEYLDSIQTESDTGNTTEESGTTQTNDTNAPYYSFTIYRNNVENGTERVYHKSGKLRATFHYKNGLADGTNKVYYENGVLAAEYPFRNDTAIDVHKEFYKNGKLKSQTSYYTDGQIGITKHYDENGNEIMQK